MLRQVCVAAALVCAARAACVREATPSVETCGHSGGCFVRRVRKVTTPAAQRDAGCADEVIKSQTPCSMDCKDCVFEFGEWGACSTTCGNGRRTRSRAVAEAAVGNGKCAGAGSESGMCESLPPCPVNCRVTGWSEWSACSGTCGLHFKARVRDAFEPAMHGGTCPTLEQTTICADLPECEQPTPRPAPAPTPIPPTPSGVGGMGGDPNRFSTTLAAADGNGIVGLGDGAAAAGDGAAPGDGADDGGGGGDSTLAIALGAGGGAVFLCALVFCLVLLYRDDDDEGDRLNGAGMAPPPRTDSFSNLDAPASGPAPVYGSTPAPPGAGGGNMPQPNMNQQAFALAAAPTNVDAHAYGPGGLPRTTSEAGGQYGALSLQGGNNDTYQPVDTTGF